MLDAVAKFHYKFLSKSQKDSSMQILQNGIRHRVEVLQWFPFTTKRKRTTIVLKVDQTLWLFTKVGFL